MWPYRNLLILLFLLVFNIKGYSQQQDVDFNLNAHLLTGKKVLKVKRDFRDPYLWVLAQNNEVYRVNSQTLVIDNYTSQFASYGINQKFVDIAGYSKDTVFIATNSTNLIVDNLGIITTVGSPQGIGAVLNTIGISTFGSGGVYPTSLVFATTTGWGTYDVKTGAIAYINDFQPNLSKIYEATYRRLMYGGDYYQELPPNSDPVTFETGYGAYGYGIQNTQTSGRYLNTAFYTLAAIYEGVYDGDFFYGNEKGLFQESENFQGEQPGGSVQYLNNITINKVTDILGLLTFGNPYFENNSNLIKETLLIGSDKGLYFTSSIYANYIAEGLHAFNIFHYDALGNTPINDICVNATTTIVPSTCENGVWLAANDGLYLLKPDYAKYVDTKQPLDAIQFNLPTNDPLSETSICTGSSVQIVNNIYMNNNFIQWQKDGQNIPGATGISLTVTEAGDYNAVLTNPCENISLSTNHLKVTTISAPVFTFNYPDKIQNCNTNPVTLSVDNNSAYSYRWYTNGVLNGSTTSSYTVTQTGKYKVEVSACTDTWIPSKEVEVDLVSLPFTTIASDKSKYCAGETATLVTNISVDPSYAINWYKDGSLISEDKDLTIITTTAGGSYSIVVSSTLANCTQASATQQITFTPAPVFTFNYPDELRYCDGSPVVLKADGSSSYQYRWYKDGVLTGNITPALSITQTGKYKVEVSSCDGSWVPSKEVQVDLVNLPAPVIAADKTAYCVGDNATLSININTDQAYTINWYKDNALIPFNINQVSLKTNAGGNYTVSVTSNTVNSDGTTCTQSSASQVINFNPVPVVSIQKIVKTTLCEGQTIDLKANYSGGTVNWSTGETADQITVSQSGNYKATVTSAAGCTADASIDVTFVPNPVLNIPDATVCVPSHKTATLTAPAGLATYTWNGQAGTETFVADHPQTVTLVVTDVNGCVATQDIQVTDECPDIKIPNTFTPNGDGINDTWDIVGLEYDPTCLVQVFTRYGQKVFESHGYGTPWNGNYGNKKLVPGTYYYIINAKNATLKYSGSVTIIY